MNATEAVEKMIAADSGAIREGESITEFTLRQVRLETLNKVLAEIEKVDYCEECEDRYEAEADARDGYYSAMETAGF